MSGKRRNGAGPLSSSARILGVDPGLKGGWAVISDTGRLLYCGTLPVMASPSCSTKTIIDSRVFAQTVAMTAPTVAVVEHVSSRPRQQGAFAFGMNVGMVLGAISICDVPYRQVSPATWKATYGLRSTNLPPVDGAISPDNVRRLMKDEARRVAASLYPEWEENFAKVQDDGVAEAVLIALHGLATNNNLTNFVATLNGASEPH